MIIACEACSGTGLNSGVSCILCGGDGEIDLLDDAFHQIKNKQNKLLTGQVWSTLLTAVDDIDGKIDPSNVFRSYLILEEIDATEYDALSDAQKASFALLLQCGMVDMNTGKMGKVGLWAMFDSESTTRASLIALLA